jgi:hypothetical protein
LNDLLSVSLKNESIVGDDVMDTSEPVLDLIVEKKMAR